MLDKRYHIDSSPDFLDFEFVSVGPKGAITKVVRNREINVKGFYNLGFGDKNPDLDYINDLNVTNNSDSKKVLATVARTLYLFTDHYPGSVVIASGSTIVQGFTEWALPTTWRRFRKILLSSDLPTQPGNLFGKV